METTPATTAKRTVKARAGKTAESKPGKSAAPAAQPKVAAAKPDKKKQAAMTAAAPPPAARKPRVKKMSTGSGNSVMAHSESEIRHMIAEAAYFMAEHRHFAPGNELQDWLVAEQAIRSQHQHA